MNTSNSPEDLTSRRNFYSLGALIALAVLFVALVLLTGALLGGIRIDLTENKQFTLSEGSKSIAANMPEPVTLDLFFSEDTSREYPQIRSYAIWVEELMEAFARHSDGQLRIRKTNPTAFSPEEDRAAEFGLQAVPVGSAGESLYFGIVGTNSVDATQTMPFLQPTKQAFLEYDLAKMISTLSRPDRPQVGLLSELPMQGGMDPSTQTPVDAWVITDQLAQLFDVRAISPGADTISEGIELLLVVHPKTISEAMRYQIDQFALGGGRVMVFVDPMAETDLGGDPSDPMSRMNAGGSSTLDGLLEAWGVAFDPSRVVGDRARALAVSPTPGAPGVRHVAIFGLSSEDMNADDIVSADLETINVSSAGWLQPVEAAGTSFEPLISSSNDAMPLDAGPLRFLTDPTVLLDGFVATGDRYTLAARLTGQASSAFDQPPEGVDGGPHLSASVGQGINVIVVADTDLLHDRMWLQKQNFLGQVLVTAFADNGNFVVNSVDNLLGSNDLISIRTRADLSRPFDRVEQIRLDAEGRYRETEQQLAAELAETERLLTEIQAARGEGEFTVLNAEQEAEVQRYLDERLRIRAELRQVRHDLQKDIDALGQRLKVVNIVFVPVLVALLGLFLARRRAGARGG